MHVFKISLSVFILSITNVFSQKTEVLDYSNYKHDYALSTLRIVEELADTGRCKYIATLRVSGSHHDGLAGEAFTLMKIKAKELGANLYHVTSYAEYGLEAEVIVRLFFGGTKMVSVNDSKRKKNSIYVFSQYRGKNDTAVVYINDERVIFNQRKFHQIEPETGKKYNLEISEKSLFHLTLTRKKQKEADFVVIPSKSNRIPVYVPGGAMPVAAAGGIGVALYFTFKNNKPQTISYDLGRFLIEIYK